jgi:hypothetical protein
MNHFNYDELIDSLKIAIPVYQVSDVFIIPKNIMANLKRSDAFFNYYSKKITNREKDYYLRSFGGAFCITPYSLWRDNDHATIYSIGDGLYKNEEKNLLLIEMFTRSESELPNISDLIANLTESEFILDYEIVEQVRWDCKWINISVILK